RDAREEAWHDARSEGRSADSPEGDALRRRYRGHRGSSMAEVAPLWSDVDHGRRLERGRVAVPSVDAGPREGASGNRGDHRVHRSRVLAEADHRADGESGRPRRAARAAYRVEAVDRIDVAVQWDTGTAGQRDSGTAEPQYSGTSFLDAEAPRKK